jgi:hypothetical protein
MSIISKSTLYAAAIVLTLLIGGGVQAQGISIGKLPGAVTNRLKEIDAALKKAEQICAKDLKTLKEDSLKNADAYVAEATQTYDKMMKDYGSKITPGHPEVAARKMKIETTRSKVAAVAEAWKAQQQTSAQAAGDAKAADAQWLARLRKYVASQGNPDYDAAHSLIIPNSQDPTELDRQRKLCAEAAALFEEFKKQPFPNGKSDELEQAARDFEFHLKGLQSSIGTSEQAGSEEANNRLTSAEALLSASESNKDPAYVPNMIGAKNVEELKAVVAQAVSTSTDSAANAAMQKRLADILARNTAICDVRKSRIKMKPTKFTGAELSEIQAKASALVLEKHADAKVIATSVTSADWKEEDVVEATDTTQTELRRRVTRSVTAQVAAKIGEDVTLYTVDVSKDRRTDGTWGAFYGNIMYSDLMLEANVAK